jgi:hypothetical protein
MSKYITRQSDRYKLADFNDRIYIGSDFLGGAGEWQNGASGTGATISFTAGATVGHHGLATLPTGSTATGRNALTTNLTSIIVGRGVSEFESQFFVPTASAAGTDEFDIRLGFLDVITGGEASDGVYLRLVGSSNFEFVCRNNGIETFSNSGVTYSDAFFAGGYARIRIVVEPNAVNKATFILDRDAGSFSWQNIASATLSNNIPYAATRLTGAGASINKRVGVNSRSLILDTLKCDIANFITG